MAKKQDIKNECTDPMQQFTIEIPCALAERIDRYAKDNKTSLEGVLIEALDSFMRRQK